MKKVESIKSLEQRHWLAQHLSGDKTAFAKLMQAYRKPVYSYLVRCGFDKNTRDDLFQDAFFKIHKSAQHYDSSLPLSPWLFTIVANIVKNHIRDQKPDHNHLSLCLSEVQELHLTDSNPQPDEQVDSTHSIQWLKKALLKLPDSQAQALNLAIINGIKIKDVAIILDQPVNTVKTHIRRARQSLIQSYKIKNNISTFKKGASHE